MDLPNLRSLTAPLLARLNATTATVTQRADHAAPGATPGAVASSTTTTARTSAPRRQRSPYAPRTRVMKFVVWLLSPVLDPHDNYPSGPRCMAWFIAIGAVFSHEISATLGTMLLSTMWGYSAWKAQQEKTTLALTAHQEANLTTTVTHSTSEAKVLEQRLPEQGFDPSRPVPDPSGGTAP
jgi:hypothetical protein